MEVGDRVTYCKDEEVLYTTEILLEPYNGKTKKTLGDRAFAVTAPRHFNSPPREIRHETCFNTFKTKVKTFLFRTAFC